MKIRIQPSDERQPEIRSFTDKLQEVAKEYEGFDVDPVDAFGGYVAVDKYAKDNLEETQENITWKTGLKPTNPWEVRE